VTIQVLLHYYVYVLVFFVLYKNGLRQYVMPCHINVLLFTFCNEAKWRRSQQKSMGYVNLLLMKKLTSLLRLFVALIHDSKDCGQLYKSPMVSVLLALFSLLYFGGT